MVLGWLAGHFAGQMAPTVADLYNNLPHTSLYTESENDNDPYAHLSESAYLDFDEAETRAMNHGYLIDRELSTPNAHVYKSSADSHAVIAYRGTNPKNADDLAADAHIAAGSRAHQRFREAEDIAQRAMKKYQKVIVTGHSLGGTQALHVNNVFGLDARVFNPGAGKGDSVTRDNATVVRHMNDLISANLRLSKGNHKIIAGPTLNPLTAHKIFVNGPPPTRKVTVPDIPIASEAAMPPVPDPISAAKATKIVAVKAAEVDRFAGTPYEIIPPPQRYRRRRRRRRRR